MKDLNETCNNLLMRIIIRNEKREVDFDLATLLVLLKKKLEVSAKEEPRRERVRNSERERSKGVA